MFIGGFVLQTIAAPTHLLTSIVLPSESYSEEAATMEAISVSGLQGETLSLNEPVNIKRNNSEMFYLVMNFKLEIYCNIYRFG